MPVLFGGQRCLDPGPLLRRCAELSLPTRWAGLPNAYLCPLGPAAGEGHVLLSRQALNELDAGLKWNGEYDLEFRHSVAHAGAGPPSLPPVVLRKMVLLDLECLTPAARDQPESAYLARFADRRHLANRVFVNAGYNLVEQLRGDHVDSSLRDPQTGSTTRALWTWQQVVQDLWRQVGTTRLGALPTLPSTPSGTPEGIECWHTPGLDAIHSVLDRVGMALAYNPLADTFSVVEAGATDAAFDAALAEWDRWRHWDSYPLYGFRGTVPEKLRVLFRKVPHLRGEGSPRLAVDAADPTSGASGWEPGTVAVVEDDLHALYDVQGNLTNRAALDARATARAAEFYRRLRAGAGGARLVYPFPVSDSRLLPGRQVVAVRWCDTASGSDPYRGMVTEVVRRGSPPPTRYPPATRSPREEPVLAQLVEKSYSGSAVSYGAIRLTNSGSSTAFGQAGQVLGRVYSEQNLDVPVYAAPSTQAARPRGAFSDPAAGDVAWHASQLGLTSDDEWATCELAAGQSTHYLKLLFCGLHGIPSSATISNVAWAVEASADGAGVPDLVVKLIVGGSVTGTSQHTGADLPTADAVRTYSASPATWGAGGLTVAQLQADDFGLAVRYDNASGAARKVRLDGALLTVTFAAAGALTGQAAYRLRRGDGNHFFVDAFTRVEVLKKRTPGASSSYGSTLKYEADRMRVDQGTKALEVVEFAYIVDASTL